MNMNFAKLKNFLPPILLIVALLFFGYYLYSNADKYAELLDFSSASIIALSCLVIVSIIGSGTINFFMFRILEVDLTLNEGIGLASVHTLANQMAFAGGVVTRGVYLKQHYQLSYRNYISATFALSMLFIAVNGVTGLVSLAYLAFSQNTDAPNLLLIGFFMMTSSIMLFWLPTNINLPSTKWNQRISQLLNGWQVLRQNNLALWQLIGTQIFIILIGAARFWVAFDILSQEITLAECVLFSSATILTHLVAITPGGLGIREAIVVGVASMLQFDMGVALVAVSLDRLISTLVIVGMGTVYTYILSKNVTTLSK
jgi:uncharacterized membrane protein YbhN (UPF0104 family)